MAKNEKPQPEDERQTRVYKASNVHKRRASGKRRPGTAVAAPEDKLEPETEGASEGDAPDAGIAFQSAPRETEQEDLVVDDVAQTEVMPVISSAEDRRDLGSIEDSRAVLRQQPESDSSTDASAPDGPANKPAHRRSRAKTIALIIALAFALVVVGLGAAFAWDRWGRYDDFADMQGEWYVAGTTASVTIEGNRMQLTEDVSYDFEIDDHAKTMSYTFGPLEGQGRYWFSDDRRFLAITDGEGYNGAVTAFEDIGRRLAALTQPVRATGAPLPEGEGVVVLCRQPGKLATLAVQAQERARKRVEKQKAAEEEAAARKAAEDEASAEREEQGESYELAVTVVEPEVATEEPQEQNIDVDGEAYEDVDEQPADDENDEVYDEYA